MNDAILVSYSTGSLRSFYIYFLLKLNLNPTFIISSVSSLSPWFLIFIAYFASSATICLHYSLVVIPFFSKFSFINRSLFPALILIICLLATFKNMFTNRFLIAKWLFSYTSHLGYTIILFVTGTTTKSLFTSVANLSMSFYRKLSFLLAM